MKLAIVGSRGIKAANIEALLGLYNLKPSVIITGGARGIDKLAEAYAVSHGIALQVFKPNYKAHLQGAPIRRNEIIAEQCETLLAIWDGQSHGTKHIIAYAEKQGKCVIVHRV